MYTQQATGLLRENANNDPQGLSSLFGSFGGAGVQQLGGIGIAGSFLLKVPKQAQFNAIVT
jgi:hypothetical protein